MYCPRCSQEQISDDLKFCPKCGLPLDLISEVVETGENPSYLDEEESVDLPFTRRNALRLGLVWFVTMLFLVAILTTIESAGKLIPIVAMLGVFGAIVIAMFAVFLGAPERSVKGLKKKKTVPSKSRLSSANKTKELKPGEPTTAREYVSPGEGYETGDMVPVSVVEKTTKLLKEE